MPPEPQPQDPHAETSKPVTPPAPTPASTPAPTPAPVVPTPQPAAKPGQVDIGKILLPKKEVPGMTTQSAQRVSAGVLLDQELKAGAEGAPKAPVAPKPPAAAPPAPRPSPEEPEAKPLETYQAAIEKMMKGGDVSVVSIAAAEAQRRSQKGTGASGPAKPPTDIKALLKKISMIGAGVLLLAVAGSVVAYLFLRPTTVPVAVDPTSPFISVDDTESVSITATEPTRDLMDKLDAEKKKVSLPLGLIERIIPSVSSTTESGQTLTAMDAQTFLSTIARNVPQNLLRNIQPAYLLGAHVYDENQPFLIFRVDSYQEAFSGMLAWEYYMRSDLAPLFNYTPSAHIPEENIPVITPPSIDGTSTSASTTGTSTASTTDETSDQPAELPPPVIQPSFVDRIVENHDARVLQNNTGDIYFLWTFIDRNTLVITTNAATLREIISRLKDAPITPTPAQ